MGKEFFERFNSIYSFMDTINKRPNASFMRGKQTSQDSDTDWYGGYTYPSALDAMASGLPELANTIKTEMARFKAVTNVTASKARPRNYYSGYAPNVAAAIIGLPKSMRQVQRVPQKVKALNVLYDMATPARTSAKDLEKAGITALKLVHLLEVNGYRVRLSVSAFTGGQRDSKEKALVLIDLKDFKQPLDLLKLSFPMTSPAMFRRFGFKWLETLPEKMQGGWYIGYGVHLDRVSMVKMLEKNHFDIKSTYLLQAEDCENADFDPVKLAKNLGIAL